MERYVTDEIYNHTVMDKSAEIELAQKVFYKKLSALLPDKEYLQIEEELNGVYSKLEKELFYRGFTAGVKFILGVGYNGI